MIISSLPSNKRATPSISYFKGGKKVPGRLFFIPILSTVCLSFPAFPDIRACFQAALCAIFLQARKKAYYLKHLYSQTQ